MEQFQKIEDLIDQFDQQLLAPITGINRNQHAILLKGITQLKAQIKVLFQKEV